MRWLLAFKQGRDFPLRHEKANPVPSTEGREVQRHSGVWGFSDLSESAWMPHSGSQDSSLSESMPYIFHETCGKAVSSTNILILQPTKFGSGFHWGWPTPQERRDALRLTIKAMDSLTMTRAWSFSFSFCKCSSAVRESHSFLSPCSIPAYRQKWQPHFININFRGSFHESRCCYMLCVSNLCFPIGKWGSSAFKTRRTTKPVPQSHPGETSQSLGKRKKSARCGRAP